MLYMLLCSVNAGYAAYALYAVCAACVVHAVYAVRLPGSRFYRQGRRSEEMEMEMLRHFTGLVVLVAPIRPYRIPLLQHLLVFWGGKKVR